MTLCSLRHAKYGSCVKMLQYRFIDNARKYPEKVAINDKATQRMVTYSQALIAALVLARRFQKLESTRIGIMMPTSSGGALAVIGALMGGLTPIMINYSTGATKNYAYAKAQCDFRTIVTSRSLLERISCEATANMVFMEDIMAGLSRFEKVLAYLKSRLPISLLKRLTGNDNLDQPAVILFTSGSEKDPKIVQLTQRNIISNIDSFTDMMNLHEMDRLLAVLPYFHVFGLTITLWTPLCLGMTTITYPNPLDFKTIASLVKQEKPQLLVGTPVFLEGYAKQSALGDFTSVILVVSGADKCPDSLRQIYHEKHQLQIIEGYGTTETSPVISVNPRDRNRPGSIGIPIPGTEVSIENIDSGEVCTPGEIGKIMVKGPGVMSGYLNDITESHLRLKSGWYDTGDLGLLDEEGYLWHKGRLKRFVKIGGEMISLVNVEETLNALLEEGIKCCAVELPDAKRGSRIIAVTNEQIDSKSVTKQLAQVLPNLALPKKYVVVEEFPCMGSGKIDFRTLTEIVRQQEETSRG